MIGAVVRGSFLNFRRDRAGLVLAFVVPIVFFSIFALVFGQTADVAAKRIELGIVDLDQTSRSRRFVAELSSDPSIEAVHALERNGETFPLTDESAEAAVRDGEFTVALVIPAGFGDAEVSMSGDGDDAPRLRLLADTSDPVSPSIVNGVIQKVAMTATPDIFLLGAFEAVEMFSGGLTDEQRATFDANLAAMGGPEAFEPSEEGGGMTFVDVEIADLLGSSKENPAIAFYAAGIGVMFLLFTAAGTGGSALLDERESGTLDRILSTRVSMTRLLAGKLVFLTGLGVVQLVVMFLWGWIAFDLDLFGHLPGFAVMTIATALASASFGLVLAAIAKTRAQLSAISTLLILTISAIGGSMFPRFLMPESLQKAGLVAFNAWALDGFVKVFWREAPLRDLVPQVAFLLGTTAVFWAVARVASRRWDVE